MGLYKIVLKYHTCMTAENDSNKNTAPIHYTIFDIVIRLSSGICFPDIIIKLRKTFDHKPMDHWNFSLRYKLKKLQSNCIKWISDVKHQRHLIITVPFTVFWLRLDYLYLQDKLWLASGWVAERRCNLHIQVAVFNSIFKLPLLCCFL